MNAVLRVVAPAPPSAALELAPPSARPRRLVLHQARSSESAAVYCGDQVLAVAMFGRHGWRRVQMALAVSPAASGHMLALVRLAQLTLAALAEDRIVVARVFPENARGRRMAALVGFRPARLKSDQWWVLRGRA